MTGPIEKIKGWLCRESAELRRQLAIAKDDADDAWESYTCQTQNLAQARADLARLQMALEPEGREALASASAASIADIYAATHQSVAHRDMAVAHVVSVALRQATTGAR